MKGCGGLYKAPTKEERRKRKAKRCVCVCVCVCVCGGPINKLEFPRGEVVKTSSSPPPLYLKILLNAEHKAPKMI